MAKHKAGKGGFGATARVTPMTREGVSDPLDLSRDGQEAHFMRRSGPGTRRKNPQRFDDMGRQMKRKGLI